MNLEYFYAQNGDTVLKLTGEMDALGCTHIRPELEQITNPENKNNIILNMNLVSFLDSSGVGVIVFLFKRLKSQGRTLEIVEVQGQPRELMELLRIDKVITVNRSTDTHSFSEKQRA